MDDLLVPLCQRRRHVLHGGRNRPQAVLEPPLFLEGPLHLCLPFFETGGGLGQLPEPLRIVLCWVGGRLGQQAVELAAQLLQGPVDVRQAHTLTQHRSKLPLHDGGELPGQGVTIQHDGINGGQDGLLERFLVQGGRLGAELLPIVQAADTPPHGALDSALGPHAPPVGRPALPAEQQVAENMLAAVLAPAGGGALSRGARLGAPPGHFQLDGVEGLPADDALMVVLNQVFGQLSGIGDHLLADAVLDEGLLEQDVPAVFLVGQDAPDMGCHPLCFSGDRGNSLALQGRLDLPDAVPGQIAVIDEADGLRLLRHDPWLAVGALLIAQQLLVLHGDMAGFHGLTLAPAHPAAGALALGLGEGPV